ncbi:hypothetical protein C8A03DRAFT_37249 [Achaetomium macrosporum]|uniref:Uncharacterized protein n=1 Tax=Achaetomium macrosporum TaxID=79813 RepID=A0AAN7C5R8_9PEZI|nr:hypothetical protein C8A03DRAFT_37249 [Achaetomium macrosporum]
MAPKESFWEDFGFKTAQKATTTQTSGRKYGIRIPSVAPQAADSNLNSDDEGGDNEGADIDVDGIDVEIPDTVPEEHWPDYEEFKDDLKTVIDLLQSTLAAKKAAEQRVKDLEQRVADLENDQGSAADVADLTRERDRYKKLYEDEAEKVTSLQASVDSLTRTANENQRLLQELQNKPPKIEYVQVLGPERIVYKEVPGPERIVYQQVPGPERIVYQPDSRWTKARHEIAATRSVSWCYHPLNEQIEEAVRNGTYLPDSDIYY